MSVDMTLSQLDEIFKDPTARHTVGSRGTAADATAASYHYFDQVEGNMTQQQFRNYESLLLDKLQDMVPFMPRNRALSKLEIINHVIDYIRHLREMVLENQQEML